MNLNILLLAGSQAAVMTTISLVLASSALIGQQMASSNPANLANLATLPLAVQYLATMVLLYPMSRLMERHGRAKVFFTAAALGSLGLIMAAYGIAQRSFIWFSLAGIFIGCFNAAGQYYRFAAAEAVAADKKNLAISLTLSGGLLAAVAGPSLARLSKDWLEPAFLASFCVLAAIAALAALLALGLRLPPLPRTTQSATARPWSELSRDPRFKLALAGGVVGYAMMNLLMTATPLAMLCSHLDFRQTSAVIQWHVVAMFAPSFFTGALIQRSGPLPVMFLGCILNLLSIAITQTGTSLNHYELALIVLGAGWNFLYVGATSLLTEVYRPEEKARIQAWNDMAVFAAVSLATLLAAPAVNVIGWEAINRWAALPVLLLALAILRHLLRQRGWVGCLVKSKP